MCVCVTFDFEAVKQYKCYTTECYPTDINIADVQACEKAETLATHSLMPSNDANARKVCNSFYGSSSVQYAKKRGFQSDGDNR